MIEKTPLENWIREKITGEPTVFNRQILERYQLNRIRYTVAYAKRNSRYYQQKLSHIEPEDIKTLDDIRLMPWTTEEDLRSEGHRMICVTQDDISRIVTLQTSGTTGQPKRIYFTQDDQELTTDFFHIGMSTFTNPGDQVLVLLPGASPGSIGDLLKKALSRMNAETLVYGVVDDTAQVENLLVNRRINVIVGIPQQLLALAKGEHAAFIRQKGTLHSVLLSTDYVSSGVKRTIEENWGCRVFQHYGMTEMGLGGGVECHGFQGYHLREADLFVEIIDPLTGVSLGDGEWGEVVFTTLTRRGMPLIRYRTGDLSRLLTTPCTCGTILKTLDKIQCRLRSSVELSNGSKLTMSDLEEVIFGIDHVTDFDARIHTTDEGERLVIGVGGKTAGVEMYQQLYRAFDESHLAPFLESANLAISFERQKPAELDGKAIHKRRIIDLRRQPMRSSF